jgi:hypothetical protein
LQLPRLQCDVKIPGSVPHRARPKKIALPNLFAEVIVAPVAPPALELEPEPTLLDQAVATWTAPEPVSAPVELHPANACQYQLNDGKPRIWCDQPAKSLGSAWCVEHYAICYTPRPRHEWQRSAASAYARAIA